MIDKGAETRLTSLAHGGGCGCKIAPDVLREILRDMPAAPHGDLLVDASTSDDAAVYRLSDDIALIATTDFFMPIVDDPYEFGRIAATNALSDIYAMGGRPIFCLAIVGMPIDKMPAETIRAILAGGASVCADARAPVAGGHSIDAAEPIYGLAAIGVASPDKIGRNSGARPGDALILGKPLGVGIFSAALKKEMLGAGDYDAMIASTTSLNRAGTDIAALDGVNAMTDVTGFGLIGHLSEICIASGVAATIREDAVPVFEGAKALAKDGVRTGASGRNWRSAGALVAAPADWPDWRRDLLTDPQTSGGLLVSCRKETASAVLAAFRHHGQSQAAIIGEIDAGAPRIVIG